MKKLLIMAAIAGFALTSCTNDEADLSVKQEQERVQISFAPPVKYAMTKAAGSTKFGSDLISKPGEMLGATYSKTENFDVFGKRYPATESYVSWESTTKIENIWGTVNATGKGNVEYQEVAYVDGNNGWYPQYPYFFLDDWKYTFAAVSPRLDVIKVNTKQDKGVVLGSAMAQFKDIVYDNRGLCITNYTADNTVVKGQMPLKNHFDLMYSERVIDKDRNSVMKTGSSLNGNTDGYNGVDMKFHHALASVHFKVCVDPEFVKEYNKAYGAGGEINANGANVDKNMFKIKSIKIKNIAKTGDFEQGITNPSHGKGAADWTESAQDQEYTFLNSVGSVDVVDGAAPASEGYCVNVPGSSETTIALAATDIVNAAAGEKYSNSLRTEPIIADAGVVGHYGLMIPQEFPALGSEELSLTDDSFIEIVYTFTAISGATSQPVTKELTKRISLKKLSDAGWLPGMKYTYIIAFRGDLIYFAPDLEEWKDATVDYTDYRDPNNTDLNHIIL